MKKCGEPCRPGGPCEKFAAAGPTHANEKLDFLLSWDVQEILQYAKAAKLKNISSMTKEQLANKIIEHDSKQERLSDGDLLDPGPRFRNESTIRREKLARGIKWVDTGLNPSAALHINIVELFRNEVLSKGLLSELQVSKPPAITQAIDGQTGFEARLVFNPDRTSGVVTFGEIIVRSKDHVSTHFCDNFPSKRTSRATNWSHTFLLSQTLQVGVLTSVKSSAPNVSGAFSAQHMTSLKTISVLKPRVFSSRVMSENKTKC